MIRRDMRELSDVARRHGAFAPTLVLNALPGVQPYTAVRVSGELTVGPPGSADDVIGLAVPSRVPGAVGVALPGEVVEFDGWSWSPGGAAIFWQHGTGVLVQGGGAGRSRLGHAIGRRALLVMPE